MIIILGMHASGTTMLAEMVCAIGYKVKPPTLGADDRHPNGHFESQEIVDINRNILKQAGGSWDKPPSHKDIMKQHRVKVVRHDVIKDPRLCLTLPLWDIEGKILMIERPQDSVALALNSVHNMPISMGLELWRIYKDRLDFNLKGKDFLRVYYNDLINGLSIKRLANYLETTKINEMRAVINKDLKHF